MNWLKKRFVHVQEAIQRYPIAMLLLLILYGVNWLAIESERFEQQGLILSLIIGIAFLVVAQQLHEHLWKQTKDRVFLYISALLLMFGYYFLMRYMMVSETQMYVETTVVFLALMMALVWIPTCRNKYTLEQIFLLVFKAFFTTILFSGIIFIGTMLVLFAIDTLIASLYGNIYVHMANLIYVLFAPIFFLSLWPPKDSIDEAFEKAVQMPKMLNKLLTYIVLPLISIYTIVVLIYILLNIRRAFWAQNIFEPMLVSYIIVTIVVMMIARQLGNPLATIWKKVIPKALFVIVILQLAATIVSMKDIGITHDRYYVLIFGLFALITSTLYNFISAIRGHIIALSFICLAILSITPPIDAFTVSRVNQVKLLEQVLEKNQMLEHNQIIANGEISRTDQEKITRFVSYLDRMYNTTKIPWLAENMMETRRFERIFGFQPVNLYDLDAPADIKTAYLDRSSLEGFDITSYEQFFQMSIYGDPEEMEKNIMEFTVDGEVYQLQARIEDHRSLIDIKGEQKLIGTIDLQAMLEQALEQGELLRVEQATFYEEMSAFNVAVMVQTVERYDGVYTAELYLFLKLKD